MEFDWINNFKGILYFMLGFVIVFLGGLYYICQWELFDIYDDKDDGGWC